VVIVARTAPRAELANATRCGASTPHAVGMGAPARSTTHDVIYYCHPRAVNTREPEICAINVDKASSTPHALAQGEVPGNLIFYKQRAVAEPRVRHRYPQLEVKLRR